MHPRGQNNAKKHASDYPAPAEEDEGMVVPEGGTIDTVTALGMLGFVFGGAMLAVACAGVWSGVQTLRQRLAHARQDIWVITCPVTDEPSMLLMENGQITECSLQGTFCGEVCQRKSSATARGNSNTSKLIELR